MKTKIIFLIIGLFIAAADKIPLFASERYFGYVNGENLIKLHPLMKQFDPKTKRFVNTASQPKPSENTEEYIKRLLEEQNKMQALIRQLDLEYGQKVIGKSMAAQKLWWVFWKRRESFKIQYDLISEAIRQAKLQGEFFLNTPSDQTLFPVVKAISGSVHDALEHLKQMRKLEIILDTSVFMPFKSDFIKSGRFVANQHWQLWNGGNLNKDNIFYSALAIKETVTKSFPQLKHRPFLAGAIDLTKDSEKLLTNITLRDPHLESPKEN